MVLAQMLDAERHRGTITNGFTPGGLLDGYKVVSLVQLEVDTGEG